MQEHSDHDKIGRVMSIMALVASGLEPIAFAVLSILVALAVPIQTLLVSFGIIGLVFSIVLYVRSQTFRDTR
ncbi:MAG: MFS transporter, partial [Exiguobacterium chiriqhucha]